jgi:hypothetical protein
LHEKLCSGQDIFICLMKYNFFFLRKTSASPSGYLGRLNLEQKKMVNEETFQFAALFGGNMHLGLAHGTCQAIWAGFRPGKVFCVTFGPGGLGPDKLKMENRQRLLCCNLIYLKMRNL